MNDFFFFFSESLSDKKEMPILIKLSFYSW